MQFQIREAHATDSRAIHSLIRAAFGDQEGREINQLVDNMLVDPTARPILALVASVDEQVAGHILFSRVRIQDDSQETAASILAPLCVHPDYQSQGIGGMLIRQGLEQLKKCGVELVFVLGYPGYYSRFGFAPAGMQGLEAPYPIPPEHADAWMAQELQPGVIRALSGKVVCCDSLDEAKYWQE